jgi:hypothetical protein
MMVVGSWRKPDLDVRNDQFGVGDDEAYDSYAWKTRQRGMERNTLV